MAKRGWKLDGNLRRFTQPCLKDRSLNGSLLIWLGPLKMIGDQR